MVIDWVHRFCSFMRTSSRHTIFVSITPLVTGFAGVLSNACHFRLIDATYIRGISFQLPNFVTVLSFQRRRHLGNGVVCVIQEHDKYVAILFLSLDKQEILFLIVILRRDSFSDCTEDTSTTM